MIKVFYDGKCGLCAKEINYYKKISPDGVFVWVDVTESCKPLEQYNISLEAALRRLHATDLNDNIYVGVDSFILIWQQIRYFKFLAFVISLPIIRQIVQFSYNKFADLRFKRLAHCQVTIEK